VPSGPCSATRDATAMRSPCSAPRGYVPLTTTREQPEGQQDPAQPKINKQTDKITYKKKKTV